ncbi:MAG: Regulator of chromosome condensation repeat-containing protein [Polaromonas sp.]|nr:Regulator of chromosome condensation repeat-containing protein [Polaromonas sp.]
MKISQISAGRDRSVVLASDGAAYGWGGIKLLGATLPPGYPGELCTTNATEIGHNRYAQPIPRALNPGAPFAMVADGYIDTLGVERSGIVLSCRPVVSQDKGAMRSAVAGLPSSPVQVALTESGGFALYADGSVWSWGMPANGQLGREAVSRLEAPAPITGLSRVASLATGHGHVLALDRSGKVWAWGANGAGQLGTGSLAQGARPLQVALPAPVKSIAAGDTHSFAIDAMGRLWGWGANNFGQVGDALNPKLAAAYFTTPQRIKTDFAVAQIDAGMFFTVAASTQGDVFAWGWNGMGQIGQQGPAFSSRPLQLKQLSNVTRLAAGVGHVLALSDQGVHAWGDNRASACGQFPSVKVQAAPVLVAFS